MVIIIGVVCENLLTICWIYKRRLQEHQGKCAVAISLFLPGDTMKRTTALVFITILVSGDGRDVTKRAIGCKELCNPTNASINLTEAFQQCCNEAEEYVLPMQFYNISCRKLIIDSYESNRSPINITTIKSECCKNVTDKDFTARRNTSSKFRLTNVTWGRVKFEKKYDLVEGAWKKETWLFFLKMVSQKCLENSTVGRGSVNISYTYPYYTNDKNKTVFSYKSPLAYLVEKKQCFSMFTVVYASLSRMWITLFLCVTWTLISGVIIWLLVSKYLGFLSFMLLL